MAVCGDCEDERALAFLRELNSIFKKKEDREKVKQAFNLSCLITDTGLPNPEIYRGKMESLGYEI